MPRGTRRRAGGFTMVELITVICIMGILATLAMTRNPARAGLQEKGFRDQLTAMLRHTRKLAVSQRRDTCVVFLAAATPPRVVGTYASATGCNAAGAPIAEPGTGQGFALDIPPGLRVTAPASVRFNPAGQPVPNADQTVTLGAQTFTVSRETGSVF